MGRRCMSVCLSIRLSVAFGWWCSHFEDVTFIRFIFSVSSLRAQTKGKIPAVIRWVSGWSETVNSNRVCYLFVLYLSVWIRPPSALKCPRRTSDGGNSEHQPEASCSLPTDVKGGSRSSGPAFHHNKVPTGQKREWSRKQAALQSAELSETWWSEPNLSALNPAQNIPLWLIGSFGSICWD